MLTTKIETDFLEQLFEDDCRCESSHATIECSTKVVAHKSVACSGRDFMICEVSYLWNMGEMTQRGYARCRNCKECITQCWTIRPI